MQSTVARFGARQRGVRNSIGFRPIFSYVAPTRARSSVGQSSGFLTHRSQVRVLPGAPVYDVCGDAAFDELTDEIQEYRA